MKISVDLLIKIASFVVILAIAYFAGSRLKVDTPPVDQESVIASLERDAENLNKTLPEIVSEGVRLDATEAGPGNLFTYIYTVIDDQAAKEMFANDKNINALTAQLKNRVCVMMEDYKKNKTTVNYLFKNDLSEIIYKIAIDPKEC
ncbi:MAG: hypothetical protein ACKOPH_11445 [Methylocystis sp.]